MIPRPQQSVSDRAQLCQIVDSAHTPHHRFLVPRIFGEFSQAVGLGGQNQDLQGKDSMEFFIYL